MDDKLSTIKIFNDKKIRTAWDSKSEEWYFSIVDVITVLTGSENPRRYWSDLKRKLKTDGAIELYEKIVQLKMQSSDGKYYLTDVATAEQLLRLIQSIPSPKAEPFKQWLATVGNERLNENADPELAINRALLTYKRKGYSDKWINQRLKSIEFRKDLTDEWDKAGIKNKEFAILTDILTESWAGMTTGQYKQYKGLKKESLRDNMTNTELVLNMLAEVSTTEISKATKPKGLEKSKKVARQGGAIANNARKELEQKTGKSAISKSNAKSIKELDQ